MESDHTPDVTAGLLVIGDEILSGRTKDKNIGMVADFCSEMGIRLREVRVVPDETEVIIAALNALRAAYTHVFTTGGIGPTHDDITADSVALAFGTQLEINEEAKRELEDRYGSFDSSPDRLRMARVPVGGTLIRNSVSGAPGFTIGNVHVMAGVPKVTEAMLGDLASRLKRGTKMLSRAVECGVGESLVAAGLRTIQDDFPSIKIGSYPQMKLGAIYTQLVLRGTDEALLDEATGRVRALVDRLHAERNITLPEDSDL